MTTEIIQAHPETKELKLRKTQKIAEHAEHAEPITESTGHKKNNINEKISAVGKKIINALKIDDTVDWGREQLKKLGLLDNWDESFYWNGRAWFNVIFKAMWGYKITGQANFPEYGPAIMVANHQSELDPFLAGSSVQRKVCWMSKAENFDIPLFKSFIKPFGTVPLRRGESDQGALKKLQAILENGGCIGMFPEGTRSPDGKLGPFHKGAARMCLELGVPYVPVAIVGAHRVMPKGKKPWEAKAGIKVEIRVGKAVYPEPGERATPENVQKLTDQMRADILELLEGTDEAKQKAIQKTVRTLNVHAVEKVKQLAEIDDELSLS